MGTYCWRNLPYDVRVKLLQYASPKGKSGWQVFLEEVNGTEMFPDLDWLECSDENYILFLLKWA